MQHLTWANGTINTLAAQHTRYQALMWKVPCGTIYTCPKKIIFFQTEKLFILRGEEGTSNCYPT